MARSRHAQRDAQRPGDEGSSPFATSHRTFSFFNKSTFSTKNAILHRLAKKLFILTSSVTPVGFHIDIVGNTSRFSFCILLFKQVAGNKFGKMRPQMQSGSFLARLLEGSGDDDQPSSSGSNEPAAEAYNPPSYIQSLSSTNSSTINNQSSSIIGGGSNRGIAQTPYLSLTSRNSSPDSTSPNSCNYNINSNANMNANSSNARLPEQTINRNISGSTLRSDEGGAQRSPGERALSPGARSVTSSCAWDESDSDSSDDE